MSMVDCYFCLLNCCFLFWLIVDCCCCTHGCCCCCCSLEEWRADNQQWGAEPSGAEPTMRRQWGADQWWPTMRSWPWLAVPSSWQPSTNNDRRADWPDDEEQSRLDDEEQSRPTMRSRADWPTSSSTTPTNDEEPEPTNNEEQEPSQPTMERAMRSRSQAKEPSQRCGWLLSLLLVVGFCYFFKPKS